MWEVTFNLLFVNNGDVILRYEFLFSCVTLTTAKNQRKRGRTKHIVPILCSEAESKQILEEVAKNGSEQSTCICRDPLLKISRIFCVHGISRAQQTHLVMYLRWKRVVTNVIKSLVT